jgi:NAD-dependent deacetylase
MIVILTGAGISKESGIDTFRDAGGLWEQERVEDVATPDGFRRNPDKVLDFYNKRRRDLLSGAVQPNAAHRALARLESERPGDLLLVTQNVDDLHERAGSMNLIHMHGELLKVRCAKCTRVLEARTDITRKDACPGCKAVGGLRPHVVWFGEMPLGMLEIDIAIQNCTTFVSIGTSGTVYPAAGFSRQARDCGAQCVELNMERTAGPEVFHQGWYGPASRVVPEWVDRMLKELPPVKRSHRNRPL